MSKIDDALERIRTELAKSRAELERSESEGGTRAQVSQIRRAGEDQLLRLRQEIEAQQALIGKREAAIAETVAAYHDAVESVRSSRADGGRLANAAWTARLDAIKTALGVSDPQAALDKVSDYDEKTSKLGGDEATEVATKSGQVEAAREAAESARKSFDAITAAASGLARSAVRAEGDAAAKLESIDKALESGRPGEALIHYSDALAIHSRFGANLSITNQRYGIGAPAQTNRQALDDQWMASANAYASALDALTSSVAELIEAEVALAVKQAERETRTSLRLFDLGSAVETP